MDLVERVENATRLYMEKQDKAHDWYHIDRVRTLALYISSAEGGDVKLVEIAALVHDIGDRKIHASEEVGILATTALLRECDAPPGLIREVVDIAQRVSFKGEGVPDDMPTLAGKIVQDADRLDALGAIGIARAFTYGGAKSRPIYDPLKGPQKYASADEYFEKYDSSTLHHFDEKLFHLKDRMHTKTARAIAASRYAFMVEFYQRFLQEWSGNDY